MNDKEREELIARMMAALEPLAKRLREQPRQHWCFTCRYGEQLRLPADPFRDPPRPSD